MTVYAWGPRRFSVSPQTVGETVEQLAAAQPDGVVTPDVLVDEARSPTSPLHAMWDWDETRAAESWWRHQARIVINSLRVVIEDAEQRPPAFVHVRVVSESGVSEGYAESYRVMSDADLRGQALREALTALRGFRRRYESLSELAPVWAALDRLNTDVEVSA